MLTRFISWEGGKKNLDYLNLPLDQCISFIHVINYNLPQFTKTMHPSPLHVASDSVSSCFTSL